MAEDEKTPDIAKMSFEDALKALESIVDRLDRGDVPLEQSITLYERGAKLQQHCEAKLREAEMRVSKIVTGADGTPQRLEPADGA